MENKEYKNITENQLEAEEKNLVKEKEPFSYFNLIYSSSLLLIMILSKFKIITAKFGLYSFTLLLFNNIIYQIRLYLRERTKIQLIFAIVDLILIVLCLYFIFSGVKLY